MLPNWNTTKILNRSTCCKKIHTYFKYLFLKSEARTCEQVVNRENQKYTKCKMWILHTSYKPAAN